jgi:hypoxanthine phosphoribosyltransferase
MHSQFEELCEGCGNAVGGRCVILHNARKFREFLQVAAAGVCPYRVGAQARDRPPNQCADCEYLLPNGDCDKFRGCDAKERRASALRLGCRYYQQLSVQRIRYVGSEIPIWKFVRTAELVALSLEIAGHLADSGIEAIIGIARSGLILAAPLSVFLHVPLFIASPRMLGVRVAGSGFRLADYGDPVVFARRRTAIVDDTVANGTTMGHVMHNLANVIDVRRAVRVVGIASPEAVSSVDVAGAVQEMPHFLEWCFANTFWIEDWGWDMDGVLCSDCCVPDRSAEYVMHLRHARPLYTPRRTPIVIVSARCEWTRAETLAWCERHKIGIRTLALWPGTEEARWQSRDTIAMWKADCIGKLKLRGYVESDEYQAYVIAREARIPVLCPQAGRVFGVEYFGHS